VAGATGTFCFSAAEINGRVARLLLARKPLRSLVCNAGP
jgi:hypothetical protein